MGENARHDACVVGMCKVVTSNVVFCMSHVSGLHMVIISWCRTHFEIAIISVSSLLELITQTVRD